MLSVCGQTKKWQKLSEFLENHDFDSRSVYSEWTEGNVEQDPKIGQEKEEVRERESTSNRGRRKMLWKSYKKSIKNAWNVESRAKRTTQQIVGWYAHGAHSLHTIPKKMSTYTSHSYQAKHTWTNLNLINISYPQMRAIWHYANYNIRSKQTTTNQPIWYHVILNSENYLYSMHTFEPIRHPLSAPPPLSRSLKFTHSQCIRSYKFVWQQLPNIEIIYWRFVSDYNNRYINISLICLIL